MQIELLRLHHRRERDKRVTTHLILSARILGVNKVYVEGEKDEKLVDSIRKVNDKWGGEIEVEHTSNWKKFIKEYEGVRVHLTMYGLPFKKQIKKIRREGRKKGKVLVIVGSEKVEGEIYGMVDYNIAVTNQPHSEITAMSLFLYELNKRKLIETFNNAKMQIISSDKGKKVIKRG